MKKKELRDKISEIFVKWNMPTRQVAINEIVNLWEKTETKISVPDNWRIGQTLFNFCEWLTFKGYSSNQSSRMADTFHIPDEEIMELYKEFLKINK